MLQRSFPEADVQRKRRILIDPQLAQELRRQAIEVPELRPWLERPPDKTEGLYQATKDYSFSGHDATRKFVVA